MGGNILDLYNNVNLPQNVPQANPQANTADPNKKGVQRGDYRFLESMGMGGGYPLNQQPQYQQGPQNFYGGYGMNQQPQTGGGMYQGQQPNYYNMAPGARMNPNPTMGKGPGMP